jgi:hypothetical protein
MDTALYAVSVDRLTLGCGTTDTHAEFRACDQQFGCVSMAREEF